jgi:hypothetical protein
MKFIHITIILMTFLSQSLFAKGNSFNPFRIKTEKNIKKRIYSKKHTKKLISRYKKDKIKKRVYNNLIKSKLPSNLNKIYKIVLKSTNINRKALKKAFAFYKRNKIKRGLSSRYIAIADYTKTAKNKRLYIINLNNGKVYRHKIAHGKYSGVIGGKVNRSSNKRHTHMTPYGFFKIGSKIRKTRKKRYKYLSVKGLEWSNRKVGLPSRMGGRDVILHPAKYVSYGGRSHGCFSICPQDTRAIFAKLKTALFYSYTGR